MAHTLRETRGPDRGCPANVAETPGANSDSPARPFILPCQRRLEGRGFKDFDAKDEETVTRRGLGLFGLLGLWRPVLGPWPIGNGPGMKHVQSGPAGAWRQRGGRRRRERRGNTIGTLSGHYRNTIGTRSGHYRDTIGTLIGEKTAHGRNLAESAHPCR